MIDHQMTVQDSAFSLAKVQAITVRDQLVNQVREAILRGTLRPGQRLVERSLAESTGTSQSSVREALQLLEVEGLVTKTTNTATFVTELPADRLREHINVRLQLEPYALVLASKRLDENDVESLEALVASLREHALHQDLYRCSREDFDFHRRLWVKSGNETLTKMLVQIGTMYFAYTSLLPGLSDEELDKRFGSHVTVAERWRAGLEDRYEKHKQLLDAVLSRDPARIRQESRRHVLEGWRWILEDEEESVNRD